MNELALILSGASGASLYAANGQMDRASGEYQSCSQGLVALRDYLEKEGAIEEGQQLPLNVRNAYEDGWFGAIK